MSTLVKYEHVSFVYTPSFCGVVIVLKDTRARAHVESEKQWEYGTF